jgi:catechol 2,3-dioxygenase-like lactoylglutathione lyase family enzyme
MATEEEYTMALELTHIWLLVDDMPRALGFYRDTLGLEVVSDLGAFVELNANERFLLALFERAAMRESEPQIAISPVAGQHAALVFEVDALDTFCASLHAKGLVFTSAETDYLPNGACAQPSCATLMAPCSACTAACPPKRRRQHEA